MLRSDARASRLEAWASKRARWRRLGASFDRFRRKSEPGRRPEAKAARCQGGPPSPQPSIRPRASVAADDLDVLAFDQLHARAREDRLARHAAAGFLRPRRVDDRLQRAARVALGWRDPARTDVDRHESGMAVAELRDLQAVGARGLRGDRGEKAGRDKRVRRHVRKSLLSILNKDRTRESVAGAGNARISGR